MTLTPFPFEAEIFEPIWPSLCEKGLLMTDEATPLVIEVAKEFMSLLQANGQPWTKGFFRFKYEGDNYGSNASYLTGDSANLISAMRNKKFYATMNELGRRLIISFGRTHGLFLLIVDRNFDYEIKFEWDELNKWEITKLNESSGVPARI